jgi:hypothetical protein
MQNHHGDSVANLTRSKLAILYGLAGLFGIVLPAYAIGILNGLLGVGMNRSDHSLFRLVATVYFVSGALVAVHMHLDHPAGLRNAVTVVLGAAVGTFLARYVWLPGSDAAIVVAILVMLIPLLVGSTVSAEGFLAAIFSLLMLMVIGTILQEPSFSASPLLTVITVTIFGLLWGLPLYILGWIWRRRPVEVSDS